MVSRTLAQGLAGVSPPLHIKSLMRIDLPFPFCSSTPLLSQPFLDCRLQGVCASPKACCLERSEVC